MGRSWIGAGMAVWSLGAWLATTTLAHPATGIVVNKKGEVFFIHTGRGVFKIDTEGKLTCLHKVGGGGHWLAWDAEGKFSTQFPQLFEKLMPEGAKPTLLYASGGAPFVVNRDGNLYYGSGYPEGDDMAPGFHTLTRLSPDGKRTLFALALKATLADMNEAVTGLSAGSDGSLFVACPNAIVKVAMDGTVKTLVHPVVVKDREDDLAKDSRTRAFHSPYLRGIDVTEDGTVYAAVTGCRCVVKITQAGQTETVLKSEKPWTPTGVAAWGKDLFVLEYTNPDKPEGWVPRVRKLGSDGRVKTLADLTRNENNGGPQTHGSIAFARWRTQTIDTKSDFRGLCVVSPNVAWVSGTRGTFARTTDGGKTLGIDQLACQVLFGIRDRRRVSQRHSSTDLGRVVQDMHGEHRSARSDQHQSALARHHHSSHGPLAVLS